MGRFGQEYIIVFVCFQYIVPLLHSFGSVLPKEVLGRRFVSYSREEFHYLYAIKVVDSYREESVLASGQNRVEIIIYTTSPQLWNRDKIWEGEQCIPFHPLPSSISISISLSHSIIIIVLLFGLSIFLLLTAVLRGYIFGDLFHFLGQIRNRGFDTLRKWIQLLLPSRRSFLSINQPIYSKEEEESKRTVSNRQW